MVDKCANPNCETTFKYSSSGRLFAFELRSPNAPCKDVPHTICEKHPSHATVCFWLCERCSHYYDLSFSIHQGVRIRTRESSRENCNPSKREKDFLRLATESQDRDVLPGIPF